MSRQIWTRTTGAAALAAAALLAGAGAAQADPPDGWQPGPDGVTYDIGGVIWRHHGWLPGERGNWHTGYVDVEEDDDGLTGQLIDWRCPEGVVPPARFYDQIPATDCKVKARATLDSIDQSVPFSSFADFDQARDRLNVHFLVDAYDDEGAKVAPVQIDLALAGLGDPEVDFQDFGDSMYYSEVYTDVNAWGKVDGHRVKGPNTEQISARAGYWLDSWIPAP